MNLDIKIVNLSKSIKKNKILSEINLKFSGVYGLLGPNGAGKTTIMKILTGLIPFSSGSVFANDEVIDNKSYVRRADLIGYLPQEFMIYPDLTIYEVLEHIAVLQGLNKHEIPSKVDQVLFQVNLSLERSKKMKELSGGMLRRVGIAQILLRNPSVLLFDEPTAGLDIEERIRFRNLLKQLGKNHTVIISSHLVEDIEFLCTRIGVIRNGKVLFEGSPAELKEKATEYTFELPVKNEELDEIIAKQEVTQMEDEGTHIKVRILSPVQVGKHANPRLVDGYLSLIKEGLYD